MILLGRTGIAAAVLASLLAAGGTAAAQVECASLGGRIVYGVGGSAQTPLIGEIASRLRDAEGDAQLTIVYSDAAGACRTTTALDPSSPAPLTGTARYWEAGSNTPQNCTLPDEGVQAQFGSMQNFWELCPNTSGLPDGVGDFQGPIGTVNVIVPLASSQNSISAEALHFVYGFGDESRVEPWTDERFIIRRNPNSAVQNYLALAVDLPSASFRGQDAMTNGNSVAWVANATNGAGDVGNPDQAIGFVSGENAENNRHRVRTLAYQHYGQECAYWPDSSVNAFDKINVRRGQYYLWGTAHLYAAVSGDESKVEDIIDDDARKLIGWMTGAIEPPDELPILDIYIDNYNVPQCAMQVRRTSDLGPIASFQPDEPCGCYFEFRATGRTSCDTCEDSDDCSGDQVCRHGFCEVR